MNVLVAANLLSEGGAVVTQILSWSFNAGAPSGVGVNTSGSASVDAVTTAAITLDANMQAAEDLALQIDDVGKVDFLVLTSTLTGGEVEIKADGAAVTKLTGPLVLFGDAIKLFAGNLGKLSVQNKSADKKAELAILLGLSLT
jgi:hypothetical protein